jgi:TolB-like protein/Tfp pilus assembly protein PilF
MRSLRSFLIELRRRHVFRVAALYGAVAWLLIQVAATTFPLFDLPAWTVRGVVVVCVTGFPVAMLLAWMFELTPDRRVVADPRADAGAASPWRSRSLWLGLAAGVLLGVGAYRGWQEFGAPPERPGIAVLTFDVLGEPGNAAFAGGLHEAVLGELAAISGLRVIARTSVLRFTEAKPDIRDVGRILDVPYVLEGSVQRDGRRLRVHAQLIDARGNVHVWSQTYDREADDVFGVQSALAKDIAGRLRVSLLPAEAARAEQAPSANPKAYDAYLRGVVAFTNYNVSEGDPPPSDALRAAIAAFDEAVRLDPAMALAYAERSRAQTQLWWDHRDETDSDWRLAALAGAQKALQLAPNSGEAHRALGAYYYWGHLDYARAEAELTRARALLPNDATTAQILAFVRRRQGRFDEAIALFIEAFHLDPMDLTLRGPAHIEPYQDRRYQVASEVTDDMLNRFPDKPGLNWLNIMIGFCRDGDTSALREAPNDMLTLHWLGAMFDGRYADALGVAETINGMDFFFYQGPLGLAETRWHSGDRAGAREAVARHLARAEAALAQSPDIFGIRNTLALMYVFSGRPEDARRTIGEHLLQTPVERGAIDHWGAVEEAVEVYALIGDREAAIEQLTALQHGPRGPCGNYLRRWPSFASIRDDPRFETLARLSDWPGRK